MTPLPPPFVTLVDWIDGRLDDETAQQVSDYVARGDARTLASVEWLREFRAVASAVPLHEPPPIVRQRLDQQFAEWVETGGVAQRKPSVLDAVLVFDSRRDLDLAGVRAGAVLDETVQLAFGTEIGDLVVDAFPTRNGRMGLDGQLLLSDPSTPAVFEASVVAADFAARTVDGDELGRFRIDDVPAQVVTLRVANGEVEIRVDLDLRPEDAER